MNRLLFLLLIALAVAGCKTQQTVAPLVIRDSISITYKQGTEQPLSLHKIEEQPTPTLICGIGEESEEMSRTAKAVLQRSGPTGQSPVVQRSGPAPVVRVDTVFVERWHTEVCQPQAVCQRSGLSGEAGLSAKRSQFYKDCTWGFFILLLLIIGRIALRITKAVCLRR